jgi:transposase
LGGSERVRKLRTCVRRSGSSSRRSGSSPTRTGAQRVLLAKSVGASRYVYNWGLAESKRQYPRFKKKGERDSARICEVTLEERHLRIPNVGRVRLKETCGERGFDGRVLRRQLADKSGWYGATLVIADRFFPASKLCSGCGTIKNTLGLNDRPCDCDACGLSLERDENAAIDLRRLGLAELPVDAGTDRPNANPHFRRRRA